MKEISLDTACALHIGPRESLVRIAEATARGGKNGAGALRDRIQGKAGDAFCCMQIDEWKLLSERNFEHSEADCESLMIIPSRHECTYSFSPLGTTAFTSGSVHEWDGVWEDTTLPSWLCVLIEGHYVTRRLPSTFCPQAERAHIKQPRSFLRIICLRSARVYQT